jgi:hypothetical protein
MPARPNIAALPEYLTWQSGADLLRAACTSHIRWLYNQLRIWSKSSATDLIGEVLALSKNSQQRLLLAPRTFFVLQATRQPSEENISAFRRFIEYERFLADRSTPYPSDAWSASCDYYLSEEHLDHGGSKKIPQQARRLGDIILDVCSPYTTERYPAEVGVVQLHSPEEIEIVAGRVQESLDQIQAVSDAAALTVRSCAQVIAAVKAPAHPDVTASVSSRALIGRMGLVNLTSERWNASKLSNQIVHEAIHSLIYKLELFESLFAEYDAAFTLTAVSPWSGRTLRLHSFVHACFVWFGLWCFWQRSGLDEETVVVLKSQALKGFLGDGPLAGVTEDVFNCILPDVRAAIDAMRDYVVARNSN